VEYVHENTARASHETVSQPVGIEPAR
jgi:hypothetical protein